MQQGSLVETVGCFESLRMEWGFPYPKKGDVLTVSSAAPHPNKHARSKGILLLTFEELPDLVPVSDKTIHGEYNFIEIHLPNEIKEALTREFISI